MKDLFIKNSDTVKQVLKKLDQTAEKILFVVNENKMLIGTVSDGDIRRGLLSGINIESSIDGIYNKSPLFLYKDEYTQDKVKNIFLEKKIEVLPLLNSKDMVVDYIRWDDVFDGEKNIISKHRSIDLPVVIMAGGKGTRLEPFTNIFPKALMPVGDKTLIEVIIDEFRKFDVKKFILTVNYKAPIIESYFNTIDKDYEIKFIKEESYLGTAGSLLLVKNDLKGTFIVSNCDIILKADYADALEFHMKQKSSLTILSSIQHHKIPYGVVKFSDGGRVTEINERPEFTFIINAGVYLLNSDVIDNIPSNTKYDMPDLINKIIEKGDNVFTYPVNENDYIDFGQWEEYEKIKNKMGGL